MSSVGSLGGVVPYTSYSARESYIDNNKDIIEGFDKAISRGLEFVNNNSSKYIAREITGFFPDTSMNDLIKVIDRYKRQDTWPNSTKFSVESFNHLQDIMISSKVIDKKVKYEDLIYE